MNKLAIPAILVAVIMVAGIFAFSPVEQASTVHGSISTEVQAVADAICSQSVGGGVDDSSDANLATGECSAVE